MKTWHRIRIVTIAVAITSTIAASWQRFRLTQQKAVDIAKAEMHKKLDKNINYLLVVFMLIMALVIYFS